MNDSLSLTIQFFGSVAAAEIIIVHSPMQDQLSIRVPGCQKITNGGLTKSGTGCFLHGQFLTWPK